MKPEEALAYVMTGRLWAAPGDYDYWKLCDIVIDALTKQIQLPVKVTIKHPKGRKDVYNEDVLQCPACKRRLRNKQKDPYCGKCGQALDWGGYDG